MKILFAALALLHAAAFAQNNPLPFVNWENHPVHPLDLSPDGSLLAIAHTADNRLQLFDVSEGSPVAAGHVLVGVDPVAVRFQTNRLAWVVNHISDSVSVVDVVSGQLMATLHTPDEPFDVVFAGSPQRAFVSCSQANTIAVFDPDNLSQPPQLLSLAAEDPRSLAVSPDRSTVYAAIFESGNASTVLGGGAEDLNTISFPPNVSRNGNTPYAGVSPAPNAGDGFSPALNPLLPRPPQVATIVKRSGDGQWLDDGGADWSDVVSGSRASLSGRVQGWDLPDRDVAVIDANTLQVSYISGLMNINMALAVNPASAELTVVGSDATNELRFEPNLNGRFLRINLARFSPGSNALSISDLNPHLTYAAPSTTEAERRKSLGDPRGMVWNATGDRAYVTGMGSNNLVVIDADGQRIGPPIATGQGPTGVVIDDTLGRIYVWNHFDATLSVIATQDLSQLDTIAVFNPLPRAIREGRPFLYDTQLTSGPGHLSCGSCHVDARGDRLAWDLGDPSGDMKPFNQNCITDAQASQCPDFHPMKGPMVTQTLQDIIGHEPFHWRGDRDGLEEFNGTYVGLMGADAVLNAGEMRALKDYLATIAFPPNPHRNLDNTLPQNLALPGQVSTGTFGPANQPLPDGNAQRGLQLYTGAAADNPFQCSDCHTLPTGMSRNGPLRVSAFLTAGGEQMPLGPMGENHLGIVSVDGSTNRAIKTSQLRNLYDKVGMDLQNGQSAAGFGFLHDGSVDSLARFVSLEAFNLSSDQEVADMVALMMAFSGSDFGPDPSPDSVPAPLSQDTHAAVGQQVTLSGSVRPARLDQLLLLSQSQAIDLIAHRAENAWLRDGGQFVAGSGSAVSLDTLSALATAASPVTFTAVPAGLGQRLALDRDGDGISNSVELTQGSNPADASSTTLAPVQGLWFNPQRSGHGFDLQRLGNFLFITWYTYNNDGSPTWYQASAEFQQNPWSAELSRFTLNPAGGVDGQAVGEASLSFDDARHATFSWTLNGRSGSEPFELLAASNDLTRRNYTGTWYNPDDSGWGVSFYSQGDVRVSVLYFYDANSQPRWVLGQSDNAASNITNVASFNGFCPDCERLDPVASPAGELQLNFSGLRDASFSSSAQYPDLTGSTWIRQNTPIVPLSDFWVDPANF